MNGKLPKGIIFCLGIVALVIGVGTPAFTAKPTPPAQLIIQFVIVQANTLQINGENFGVNPVVTLAGTALTVTCSNPNQIVASLSPTPAAGTYKVTVVAGTASTQRGEFYVTIGAVGALGVYDGSGLFLGFLIHYGSIENYTNGYQVFNPDIPAVLYLKTDLYPPVFKPCDRNSYFYFSDLNCTSQPYVLPVFGCGLYDLIYDLESGKYYIRDTGLPIVKHEDLQSVICQGNCDPTPSCGNYSGSTAFPVKEIPIPDLLNQALQYPIVVKPIQ